MANPLTVGHGDGPSPGLLDLRGLSPSPAGEGIEEDGGLWPSGLQEAGSSDPQMDGAASAASCRAATRPQFVLVLQENHG